MYIRLIKHLKVEEEVDVLIWGGREFQSASVMGIKENLVAEVREKGIRMLEGL